MKTIGAFEAKTRFSQILREVEQGECYEVLRRNKPVARITGITQENSAEKIRQMLARIREFRKSVSITQQEIQAWIDEGRK